MIAASLRRWLGGLLTLLGVVVLLGAFAPLARAEVEDTEVSHAIAVAFDNSGSMSQSTDRWCTAKYSLEVLAAMMGSKDTLIIEPMLTIDGLNTGFVVDGSKPASERVAQVHSADLGTAYNTDPGTAATALEKLLAVPADERYLVITTDGKFMSVDGMAGIDVVRQTVAVCEQYDPPIKVLYLAIGDDVDTIDEGPNVFVEHPGKGEEVLESMKNIANKIYGRARLDSSYYDAKTGKLSFDVPMGSLIVLAQGKGAQVGTISGEGGTATPDTAKVKYNKHPYKLNDALQANKLYRDSNYEEKYYNHAEVNKNLQGMVGVYDEQLSAGSYQLDAQGSNIEVYYKPYVDVAVVLSDESGLTFNLSDAQQTTAIPHGDYTVTYQLRDPDTKQALSSKLLTGGEFALRVESGDLSATYGTGDLVTLEAGTPNLTATVELPSHVRVTRKFEAVKVAADSLPLDVDLSELPTSLDVAGYEEDAAAGTVRISKRNGEELTADEWDRMVVTATSEEDGPQWSVTKTDEVGVVSVRPSYGSRTADEEEQRLLGIPLPLLEKVFRVPSETYPTSLSAFVPDDIQPYAGGNKTEVTVSCSWTHSYLRWAIAAALVTFITWLAWFLGTWPRLPKVRPRLQTPSREWEPVKLKVHAPKGGGKRTRRCLVHDKGRLLPRRTEIMTFGPDLTESPYDMGEWVLGTAFTIEAVKAKRGRRRFRFTEQTVRALEGLSEAATDGLSDPKWNGYGGTFAADEPGPWGTGKPIDPDLESLNRYQIIFE